MIQKFIVILTISILFQTVFVGALLKCLQCESDKNADCINDLSKIQSTDCKEGDEYCLTRVDNGNVIRECSKDNNCSTPECKSTKDEGGNKHNVCQTCNAASDAKCAQSEKAVGAFTKVCDAEKTECLTNIKGTDTERHCATEDEKKACTDGKTCEVCPKGNCNSGIFPTNRLRCLQCDETNDKCKSANGVDATACQFYDSNDECYMHATNETSMIRGCVSDTKENKCSKPKDIELCQTCNRDYCNDYTYLHDQSLKCIQCTDTENCKWGFNANEAKNCNNKIPYNKVGMCYTQIKDGNVVRGCFYDRKDDAGACNNDTKCETCDEKEHNGCNNMDKADFTCKVCRSDVNWDCFDKAESIEGKPCRNPVQKDKRGCFRGIWNGVVIRGCLVDADERVEATCRINNTQKCEFCLEKDCNKMKTSAAGSLNGFATLFLLGIVWLVQKL